MSTFIQDFLKLWIPGRRRLSKKHEENRAKAFELQRLLLNQYQSLASLPLEKCHTENLGEWDPEKFATFLAEPERAREWDEAKAILSQVEIPEMSGGVNPGDQRLIFNLIRYLRPQRILEVGTHIGASTLHLATALRLRSSHTPGTLTTVDIKDVNDDHLKPWLEFGCAKSPKEMIDLIGAQDLVSFRISDSVDFLETCNEKFDFIFLDGNHSAETVYKEVPPALKCLSKNGVILLHDFFPEMKPLWPDDTIENTIFHQSVIPGPFLAIQRLQRENNHLLVHPFGGLPWPTKLGSNVTSLALLSLKPFD